MPHSVRGQPPSRVNGNKKPTKLKIHLNELTEEQQWAGYLQEKVARVEDVKGPHPSLCPPFLKEGISRHIVHSTKACLRHQTRPVSSTFSWTSKASWFSFLLLNHEDSDPSLGSHSTTNTQRQSLVPHTLTAIIGTGTASPYRVAALS